MKKRVFVIITIAIAALLVVFKLLTPKKTEYVMGKVEKHTVTEIVSESGLITASGIVEIYSPTNGVTSHLYVSNNSVVTENQKLFTVKSTATPQEKADAFAAYEAAKVSVQQAENNRRATLATVSRVLDDVKDHSADETHTQKETRTLAEVTNDNAYDAIKAAEAQLRSAQQRYQATLNTTVTAPISGTVSNLSAAPNSHVAANLPLSPAQSVLIINSPSATEVRVTIGETDINKINIGQEADLKFDAVDNKIYKGIVNRFDSNGTVSQGVTKFNVYVSVIDSDNQLKSGMNADVDITTNVQKDALTVPNAAVKPYQKGRAVRILNSKNEIEYLPVKVGIKGKEYSQIIEGINLDQSIIISLPSEKAPKAGFFQL